MTDVYLCWWPDDGQSEADALPITARRLFPDSDNEYVRLMVTPNSHEHAAELAAEEVDQDQQRICVKRKGDHVVRTFDVERSQFRAEEVG